MLEVIQSGGWLMLPILACSVIALAIVCERFWSLRLQSIAPSHLTSQVTALAGRGELTEAKLDELKARSTLGQILAKAWECQHEAGEAFTSHLESSGKAVVLGLERYLNALGTIAAITPLLGLLGTVVGMIKVFTVIMAQGVGDPTVLAGGISEALVTTAAGLSVAIPSLICYRIFQRRVDVYALLLEQETKRFVSELKLGSAK